MNSMRPIGIITDRDIVVRVVAKGQDPDSLRSDQVMSIDPATIEVDAPLREAILLMERRQIRRLIVVDRQGRLRGMLAQADIAEATTRLESGELLQQISEPGPQESRGRYH
jgi:CBS domain-containing protein